LQPLSTIVPAFSRENSPTGGKLDRGARRGRFETR